MKRREFLGALGGAATWPVVARAQPARIPVIGFMSSRSPSDSEKLVKAFAKGLADNGFADGRNIEINYEWANGNYERLKVIAKTFVNEKVAVMVAVGGVNSAAAAKDATSIIPIVFSVGNDPVKEGLVRSFNRPGGNITGVYLATTSLEA